MRIMFGKGRMRRAFSVTLVLLATYFSCHILLSLPTGVLDTSVDNKRKAIRWNDASNPEVPGRVAKPQVFETIVKGLDPAETRLANISRESSPDSPLLVLVLSSMPRSGSTLLSDLLSNIQGSITFFEPLWPIEKRPTCMSDVNCVNQYLREVFSCTFKDDFEHWLKSKRLFFQYFSMEARQCLAIENSPSKKKCMRKMDLHNLCNAAPVRFMKVIRARVRWFKSLLEDPLLNLKIIHLSRDPRGSLNSISKFRWNNDANSRCSDLEDDLITFDTYQKLFPSRLLQVHYEDFCIHPLQVTSDILTFLKGDPFVPPIIREFLTKHMTQSTDTSVMSTYKDSKKHFEAWRNIIPVAYMKSIENEPTCLNSIRHMRHTVFGSKENVRNFSISLLLDGDRYL